ncbi:hypothetical protein GKE82_20710 [Conexibacter sp. W3-3-2]|uniref:hypothetical protein n=1 Tax=Conexibacter sp. W3-3-2 TaxID=2675227 RepID=UPI0012B7B0B0|nr:hypothetical protein [Conexibacter sp. W3-3-2]MTD46645.1 hypothetical protein [Conexibacter sp. W3-3-2]
MGFPGRGRAGLRAPLLALVALAVAGPAAGSAGAAVDQTPAYELVHGCYALQAKGGGFLAQNGSTWRASAKDAASAEPLRMQATALGRYLLYGKDRDFLAVAGRGTTTTTTPGPAADWRVVAQEGGGFRLATLDGTKGLVAPGDGALALADGADSGTPFLAVRRDGCAVFPEIETGVTGEPSRGSAPQAETRGLIDEHLHHMAFQFLGGSVHCGAPWSPYGVTVALPDCSKEPLANAETGLAGTVLGGDPLADPVGWPTFKSWPAHDMLAHEGTYWKWMERAWRAGLRHTTVLLVENAFLCNVLPVKKYGCNEMDTVKRQYDTFHDYVDYIDAQFGGPGKGFMRIVTDPFEAREAINDGKLAVTLGIEVSKLFDCGVYNGQPSCDNGWVDKQLDYWWDRGIRQMEIVNKFDNGFTGVAGDSGEVGLAINAANRIETGSFWDMKPCADGHNHDREQIGVPGTGRGELLGSLLGAIVPPGQVPIYDPGPMCNQAGLSPVGAYLVRRMAEKGMIFDPDHMSVVARDQALTIMEALDYPGVMSSHSWSDPSALPRILKLGGYVTPYAGNTTSFVRQWRETKRVRSDRYRFGFGFGSDINGFGAQGGPRVGAATDSPVTYPFTSFDGKQRIERQVSGERVYDINRDGLAHYGLYPDWLEDLRQLAGQEIIDDMARGTETLLLTWERAVGVPADGTRPKGATFSRRGLGAVRLHDRWTDLLRRGGQPDARTGRVFSYRVAGAKNRRARVRALFTSRGRVGLVASTAAGHTAGGLGVGDRATRLQGRTEAFGANVRARRLPGGGRILYGIRDGRVRFTAVAAASVARTPAQAARALRQAGLR